MIIQKDFSELPLPGRRAGGGLRILTISNLYPPFYLGGYELVCLDVVNYLRDRGHAVTVLTSSYGLTSPQVDGGVHRVLAFPTPPTLSRRELIRREWRHRQAFRRVLAQAEPDVIHVFSLYGVSQSLLYAAHRFRVPVVYDFSAEWLSPGCLGDLWVRFWAAPAGRPYRQAAKAVVRRVLDRWLPTGREHLDLSYSYFTSQRIREIFVGKGFPVAGSAIIYRGVDLRRFRSEPRPISGGPVRLLFAGRLARDKGLHTVVEAMEIMARAGTVGRSSGTITSGRNNIRSAPGSPSVSTSLRQFTACSKYAGRDWRSILTGEEAGPIRGLARRKCQRPVGVRIHRGEIDESRFR
jgi:glycosyltransferase involved in cell wall biosynthesis